MHATNYHAAVTPRFAGGYAGHERRSPRTRKADPLKEHGDKGKASLSSHLPVGESNFDFVHSAVVEFIYFVLFLLLHGVGRLQTKDSIAKGGFLLRVN
jgi:hypothetical protein